MGKDGLNEEYFLLTDKLDEIKWALEDKCNDIDCDKYMYKDLLKKKYRPVLEHNYSCLKKLKREHAAVLRLLSLNKFRKLRHKKCSGCKKLLDTLSNKSVIVSFTRPSEHMLNSQKTYEWKGFWVHNVCKKNFKNIVGWKRL